MRSYFADISLWKWQYLQLPKKLGSAHPSIAPYQALKCKDGHFIVAVGNDSLWQKFCAVLGLTDLGADQQWATNPQRAARRDELIPLLEARLQDQTVAELVERCEGAGVPAGPIYSLDQAYRDPQVIARDMVVEVDHPTVGPVKMVGIPIKLSDTPGEIRTAPPTLGQHSDEILRGLGYTNEQIAAMRAAGAI